MDARGRLTTGSAGSTGSEGRVGTAGSAVAGGWLRRIAAFTDDPSGGNPAGVWVGDVLPDDAAMQRIAAEVGYSETAFAAPARGGDRTVRYFTPTAEVPFCGHATIALGRVVGDAEGSGAYRLRTAGGTVELAVEVGGAGGAATATLTSVTPSHREAPGDLADRVLRLFGWTAEDLDPRVPTVVANAGADHLVLAARQGSRLDRIDHDYDGLADVMVEHGLITVALIYLEGPGAIRARNAGAGVGIDEDPATGAAAAAVGGLLRALGLVDPPTDVVVRQGAEMGRPSRLDVHIPVAGGIRVAGQAVDLPEPA